MNVTITPTRLTGVIEPPPSKSQAHRLLIAAALAGGVSKISNVAFSQDILATLNCMQAMGTRVERPSAVELELHGLGRSIPQYRDPAYLHSFDCGESGSTLRFLIPIALAVVGGGVFTGRGRLMERPQKPYFDIFDRIGVKYRLENGALTVEGELVPGVYELPGDVSSQFITGLLYALPLLAGDSGIRLTTKLESASYVDMTLDVLRAHGVTVEAVDGGWKVPGKQTYAPIDAAVEADWSQAGFWYAAAGVDNDVTIAGMDPASKQGDRKIQDFYYQLCMGGEAVLDVADCPDLVPPLAAHAALRKGVTRIINAGRLRIKESDRLAAVTQVLNAMGAQVEEGADCLTITGQDTLAGGVTVDSHNDHRIAMMAAIAATRCKDPVTITGAQCVKKSYPDFWEDYEDLGGIITKEGET